jgi:hypothetical protein
MKTENFQLILLQSDLKIELEKQLIKENKIHSKKDIPKKI